MGGAAADSPECLYCKVQSSLRTTHPTALDAAKRASLQMMSQLSLGSVMPSHAHPALGGVLGNGVCGRPGAPLGESPVYGGTVAGLISRAEQCGALGKPTGSMGSVLLSSATCCDRISSTISIMDVDSRARHSYPSSLQSMGGQPARVVQTSERESSFTWAFEAVRIKREVLSIVRNRLASQCFSWGQEDSIHVRIVVNEAFREVAVRSRVRLDASPTWMVILAAEVTNQIEKEQRCSLEMRRFLDVLPGRMRLDLLRLQREIARMPHAFGRWAMKRIGGSRWTVKELRATLKELLKWYREKVDRGLLQIFKAWIRRNRIEKVLRRAERPDPGFSAERPPPNLRDLLHTWAHGFRAPPRESGMNRTSFIPARMITS